MFDVTYRWSLPTAQLTEAKSGMAVAMAWGEVEIRSRWSAGTEFWLCEMTKFWTSTARQRTPPSCNTADLLRGEILN